MTEGATASTQTLSAAAEFLRGASRLAVMAHVNPDADAIGSVLGLTLGLRSVGKDVTPLLSDALPEYALFLNGAREIGDKLPVADIDAIVCVDAAGIDRVGALYLDQPREFERLPVLNVDHHRTNPLFGTVNFVDGAASSTSELVYRLLCSLGVTIDVDTANALLFGIVGDTGSFRNGATTPGSLEVAGRLVAVGADVQLIAFQLFEAMTFAAARLWGAIVGTVTLDREREIVTAYMTQQMLADTGASSDEVEGVAEYLRGVKEAETVMLLKENPDGSVRVSFRSRPAIDVSIIATDLGGGGHRQAAGCTVSGPIEMAGSTLVAAYDKFYPR